MIAAALRALKDGADARTQLELALVKAAEPAHDPSVKALLARIERLEARAAGGAPPAPANRAPSEPATAAGRTRVAVSAQVEDQPPVAAAATLPGAPEGGNPEAQKAAERGRRGGLRGAGGRRERDRGGRRRARRADSVRAVARALARRLRRHVAGRDRVARRARTGCSPRCCARRSRCELSGQGLTLAWPESAAFSKRQAEDPAKRQLLAESIRAVTGASLRLAFELRADEEVAPAGEAIDEEELVDRFKREFSAVEEPPPTEET